MKRLGFDLILLGDPASGKDTQAAILQRKYALRPVESGKYWRALAKKNNRDGRSLNKTMSLGHPTPVSLMKKFLIENIKKAPQNKDLIFIGNPRLKPEAQLLKKLLLDRKRDFYVLYITLPEPEIWRRSKNRVRMAREDQDQYIINRIKYTKNQVSKTRAYFQSLKKIKNIRGDQSISKVAENIQKIINDYQRS